MTALGLHAVDAPPENELLQGLEQQEIDLILAAARPRHYRPKSVITCQSQPADELFLLCRGRARYFLHTPNGKKLILVWITPGHIFGLAALEHTPSTYIVSSEAVGTEAVRDCAVLVWDGPTIRGLVQRFPRLMENAFHTSAEYLSWYAATHAALTSQSARERLAHVLLGYAPSIGQQVKGGIEIEVTNEELADAANITHYTASRIINEWQRAGAIRKHRGKIVLRSDKGLFSRAA